MLNLHVSRFLCSCFSGERGLRHGFQHESYQCSSDKRKVSDFRYKFIISNSVCSYLAKPSSKGNLKFKNKGVNNHFGGSICGSCAPVLELEFRNCF